MKKAFVCFKAHYKLLLISIGCLITDVRSTFQHRFRIQLKLDGTFNIDYRQLISKDTFSNGYKTINVENM